MELLVVTGGGRAPPWVDDACADWAKRIERHFAIRIVDKLPKLGTRARLVVLDERGEERTSDSFAALLEEGIRASASPLVFVIGGPFGVAPEIAAVAWKTVRLSNLVLNHAVARIVLVEQIYRACSIRSGSPYHHA